MGAGGGAELKGVVLPGGPGPGSRPGWTPQLRVPHPTPPPAPRSSPYFKHARFLTLLEKGAPVPLVPSGGAEKAQPSERAPPAPQDPALCSVAGRWRRSRGQGGVDSSAGGKNKRFGLHSAALASADTHFLPGGRPRSGGLPRAEVSLGRGSPARPSPHVISPQCHRIQLTPDPSWSQTWVPGYYCCHLHTTFLCFLSHLGVLEYTDKEEIQSPPPRSTSPLRSHCTYTKCSSLLSA